MSTVTLRRTYDVSKEFDVEEMKGIIRGNAGETKNSMYQVRGSGSYYALGLVATYVDRFGIDFLREMLAMGYKMNPDWNKTALDLFLEGCSAMTPEVIRETVDILLEAGDQFKASISCTFVRSQPLELIQWLVEKGWKPHAVAMRYAVNPERASYLFSLGVKVNPHWAYEYSIEAIQSLADAGWDVNEVDRYGCTALYYLCRSTCGCSRGCLSKSRLDGIRLLLSLGADPDHASRDGKTPKGQFIEDFGPWEKHIGFQPFMTEVAGEQWRIARLDNKRLEASRLTLDSGLLRLEVPYEVLNSTFKGTPKPVCVFQLEDQLVVHEFE